MKKLIFFLTLILIYITVRYINIMNTTTRITVDPSNVEKISINMFGIGINGFYEPSLYTEDKDKIIKVVEFFNYAMRFKENRREYIPTNKTPIGGITMRDKNGKVIYDIDFYGDVGLYEKKQYMHNYFSIYVMLPRLIEQLDENQTDYTK
ncbi:MAG: hypothetical protein GX387_07335 [Clostridium sp.]|nr:hypothetical protein [Clostridium sp.]